MAPHGVTLTAPILSFSRLRVRGLTNSPRFHPIMVRGRIKRGKGMGGDPYMYIRPDRIEIVVSKTLENSLPDMRSRWEQWSGCRNPNLKQFPIAKE
ncbi:hypothetical protein RIF29_45473 [Crotalaria pallida]|uniref:Uncharacterized protein n=1 Tax=Crotalaria pallida TaxID=3830 RepID=A0AAN9HIS6_CROPI